MYIKKKLKLSNCSLLRLLIMRQPGVLAVVTHLCCFLVSHRQKCPHPLASCLILKLQICSLPVTSSSKLIHHVIFCRRIRNHPSAISSDTDNIKLVTFTYIWPYACTFGGEIIDQNSANISRIIQNVLLQCLFKC